MDDRSETLESAQEAAQKAGLTLGQWLDSVIRAGPAAPAPRAGQNDLDRLGQHLVSLAERLSHLTPGPAVRETPDRLVHALDDLNRRLDRLLEARPAIPRSPPAARPPVAPSADDIERAVAEIAARQRALDTPAPTTGTAAVRARSFPPDPSALPLPPVPAPGSPSAGAPDLSTLHEQLRALTTQIAAMNRPCGVESAVGELRQELAEIWRTVAEAMPRRALEAIETEVRALSARIDAERYRPADTAAIDGLERGLAEVRDALRALTPAESLAGLEQTIKALAKKIDFFAANGVGEGALDQVKAAVSGLREVAAGVASSDALSALMADVHGISAKIERLLEIDARPGLEAITHQIGTLSERVGRGGERDVADAIERSTDAIAAKIGQLLTSGTLPGTEALAGQLSALAAKFENAGNDRDAAEQLGTRLHGLIEQLESSGPPRKALEHLERSISSLAVQVGEARISAVDAAERAAKAVVREVMNSTAPSSTDDLLALKHDFSELRVQQAASEQRTHSTLDGVHRTLERLVDRVASFDVVRRDEAPPQKESRPAAGAAPDPAIGAPAAPREAKPAPKTPIFQAREPRPIDPTLPADTPLEPGTARTRVLAPSESPGPAAKTAETVRENTPDAASKSSFVAAARRAAQAAQAESAALTHQAGKAPKELAAGAGTPRFLERHRRSILIGVGAILLVVSVAHLASTLLGGRPDLSRQRPSTPPATSGSGLPSATPPSESEGSRTGASKQSGLAPVTRPVPTAIPASGSLGSFEAAPFDPSDRAKEATGTIGRTAPAAPAVPSQTSVAARESPAAPEISREAASPSSLAGDALPPAIGNQALRAAAEGGNAAAEYEIGARYAEGRGVPQNPTEAVRWLERAAGRGLAPAQYRLGSMYEKGQGVKKDAEKARRLYRAASEKGNAKAMHNLAVLYAEGIDGKPDYGNAAKWFRRAADRGVGDSQYNLGILYARGIGVEQNLAESFKWFALAAKQGDQDAGKKREDVAQRLDPQSLVAARLAVQTWTAQPQPEEATTVKAPGVGDQPSTAPAAGRSRSAPPQRKS